MCPLSRSAHAALVFHREKDLTATTILAYENYLAAVRTRAAKDFGQDLGRRAKSEGRVLWGKHWEMLFDRSVSGESLHSSLDSVWLLVFFSCELGSTDYAIGVQRRTR